MIELIVAVCLIDQPNSCRDVHLGSNQENVSLNQCVMRGQLEMARWIGENPDWQIKKWKCQPAGQVAKLQ